MKQVLIFFLTLGLLSGCTRMGIDIPWPRKPAETPSVEPDPSDIEEGAAAPVPPTARTIEDFDTTTPQERASAATSAAASERDLGITIASLGTATEPGFWLKTPLVSERAEGRVLYPVNGKWVKVDLIPIDGPRTAGSRMSLAALRLIDAPLTGLPEVRVYRAAQ